MLCALGMTSTVLAYDLAQIGIQCVDIGHLDIEYEWMKLGVLEKCVIEGKAVNEINYTPEKQFEDDCYHKSIVYKIL